MSITAQHLAHQFRVAQGAARMNLRGVSAEEALVVPEGGGSSANWLVGHIVHMRGGVHRLLGIEVAQGADRLAPYARGSTVPAPADAVALKELLRMWKASQAAVEDALTGAEDALFERPLDAPDPLLGDTIGSALAFLAFHEAYHVGQLGMTRRRLGKDGAIT